MLGLPEHITACLFDLDGVLTPTADVHQAAWERTFNAFLREHAERTGDAFVPFKVPDDYHRYVDGRARADGVRTFLQSRDIQLPEGTPADPATAETVHGLGNRKNVVFHQILEAEGVEVFEGSRRYLAAVVDAGLGVAVVTSSANGRQILEVTGLDRFVQYRVDGVTMREEQLPGKPAPDSFLRAAELLQVPPQDGAVFEDALSGVAAGRAGGFGYVIGVDRLGQREALLQHGADIVVDDLAELL